jgi:serine/threonine-protein kinase SRPK3
MQYFLWPSYDDYALCPWHQRGRERQYVAVKILTAHATQVQRQLSDELGLLQFVKNLAAESRNPGRTHIVTLIDSFEVSSTQGHHLCLVHEAMGLFPKVNNQGLPVSLVKVVARQLLMASDFLHRECHVIHTGAPLSRIVGVMSELKYH